MLAEAGRAHPDERVDFVRADARALPPVLADTYDLAVSFGAFGHFLPAERPALFSGVHRALRPGGVFAFPIGAPIPPSSPVWWTAAGFDAAMRVRNAVWRPSFVMYYRTFPLSGVRRDLEAAGLHRGDRAAGSLRAAGRGRSPLAAGTGPAYLAESLRHHRCTGHNR